MDSARQAVLQYVMGRQLVTDSDFNRVIVAAYTVAQGRCDEVQRVIVVVVVVVEPRSDDRESDCLIIRWLDLQLTIIVSAVRVPSTEALVATINATLRPIYMKLAMTQREDTGERVWGLVSDLNDAEEKMAWLLF